MSAAWRIADIDNNRAVLALLDRTQPDESLDADGTSPHATGGDADRTRRGWQRPLDWLRRARQFFVALTFSSLDAPHRLAQPRRPLRAGRQHSLSLAVSRRPDRRARAELAGAGRNHRQRHCRFGHGRNQYDHDRSRPLARSQARRNLRRAGRTLRPRFPDQSRARRAGAAAADLADQDACAHLRPRRRADPRQPQPLWPRRCAAFRTAAADHREARLCRTHDDRGPNLAQSRRPSAVSRTRSGKRQRLSGSATVARRSEEQHGAHQRTGRSHRLGRRASAALPRRAWFADAVDPGRRHRSDGDRRASGDSESVCGRRGGDDRAVAAAGIDHRRSGATPRRQRRARSPPHPHPCRDSGFHTPPRRDRPSSPVRCAT